MEFIEDISGHNLINLECLRYLIETNGRHFMVVNEDVNTKRIYEISELEYEKHFSKKYEWKD